MSLGLIVGGRDRGLLGLNLGLGGGGGDDGGLGRGSGLGSGSGLGRDGGWKELSATTDGTYGRGGGLL